MKTLYHPTIIFLLSNATLGPSPVAAFAPLPSTTTSRNRLNQANYGRKIRVLTPSPFHTPNDLSTISISPSSSFSPTTSLSLSLPPIAETLLTTSSTVPLLPSFLLNGTLFLLLRSKLAKMLTPEGYFHSLALGTCLWHTLGWQGWTTCVLYLFFGSLVTKVKFREKEAMGIAEGRGGRRGPENVWGSAATGLLCAAAAVNLPDGGVTLIPGLGLSLTRELLVLGYVASLATKLADTFASEIGKAYGKTTFLITTFEKVPPGTEGAVSLEGTVAAAFGGSLLPIYASVIGLLNYQSALGAVGIATLAAFLATNAESLIGASLQGKKGLEWMTNEVVNFFNTVIGAGIAIGLGSILL